MRLYQKDLGFSKSQFLRLKDRIVCQHCVLRIGTKKVALHSCSLAEVGISDAHGSTATHHRQHNSKIRDPSSCCLAFADLTTGSEIAWETLASCGGKGWAGKCLASTLTSPRKMAESGSNQQPTAIFRWSFDAPLLSCGCFFTYRLTMGRNEDGRGLPKQQRARIWRIRPYQGRREWVSEYQGDLLYGVAADHGDLVERDTGNIWQPTIRRAVGPLNALVAAQRVLSTIPLRIVTDGQTLFATRRTDFETGLLRVRSVSGGKTAVVQTRRMVSGRWAFEMDWEWRRGPRTMDSVSRVQNR